MGQSLKRLVPGSDQSKEIEIGSTIAECYDEYFAGKTKGWNITNFHRAICLTVEKINKKLNSTQIRIPDVATLQQVYKKHVEGKGQRLKEEDFQKILQELMMDIRLTGFGSKDTILYVFGIPAAASLVKQRLPLQAIPNDLFIPGVTSATVFLLSKLHKI